MNLFKCFLKLCIKEYENYKKMMDYYETMEGEMNKKQKKLFRNCTTLWSKIVKIKAGYKSEYSGQEGTLHSHHLLGKSSYALRFDTRGGICLTAGEHNFKAHADDSYNFVSELREIVRRREGNEIIKILEMQKNRTGARLDIIELELKQELKELKQ